VKVPELAMTALVVSTGTLAGVQLAAVFQLPLAADAHDVCAGLRWAKSKTIATDEKNFASLGKRRRNISFGIIKNPARRASI
jgi:hypothetical protein